MSLMSFIILVCCACADCAPRVLAQTRRLAELRRGCAKGFVAEGRSESFAKGFAEGLAEGFSKIHVS